MLDDPHFRLDSAVLPGSAERRFVIVDADGFCTPRRTAWLQFLTDAGKSPSGMVAGVKGNLIDYDMGDIDAYTLAPRLRAALCPRRRHRRPQHHCTRCPSRT